MDKVTFAYTYVGLPDKDLKDFSQTELREWHDICSDRINADEWGEDTDDAFQYCTVVKDIEIEMERRGTFNDVKFWLI